MIVKSKATYVRISPRKLRYVIDNIRQKSVVEAYSILDRTTRKAAPILRKLLQSAVDAAEKNKKIGVEYLYVSKIFADQAGMMKRWRSMSMGRAGVIRKKLSHVTVELDRLSKPVDLPTPIEVDSKKKSKKKAEVTA